MADSSNTNQTKLENIYKTIISSSVSGGTGASEYIDILNDFCWSANSINGSTTGKLSQIPVCYAIERQQTLSSSISSIINNLMVGNNGISTITSGVETVIKSLSDAFPEMFGNKSSDSEADKNAKITSLSSTATTIATGIKNLNTQAKSFADAYTSGSNLNSDLLYPYRYMYFTQATDKNYTFPLFSEDSSNFIKVSNNYGDQVDESKLMQLDLVDTLENYALGAGRLGNDIKNITALMNGRHGDTVRQSFVEKVKFYQYSTEGEKITVKFPLYNTVKKDIWKKHYKFLFNFILRNLPFKTDNTTFKPPLFYDVIIPGQKRLPLAIVSSVNVNPQGIIRNMKHDSIFDSSLISAIGGSIISNYSVSVPEAWVVTITFQNMFGNSGNQFLSSLSDLPSIKVTTR